MKRPTLTTPGTRISNSIILCGLLAISLPCFAASASRRARAAAAFARAARMRVTLATQPEAARRKADYEKLIRTFRAVYVLDPAYRKTPVALAAAAELYEEMGRRFSDDRYYQKSIDAYNFLISQYPQSSLARDALFTIAEIYRSDLENREDARAAFQKYLDEYPESVQAGEARDALKRIEQAQVERETAPGTLRGGRGEKKQAEGMPEVTAIRDWVGPNYTRVVISVEGEVKLDASRVHNPDRIVFDLLNARLSPALVGKTFPVENGFLHQIRIAQYRPNVTRVVLDVEKIEDYSVFSLPNPFRLVIDVRGAALQEARKAPAKSGAAPQATLESALPQPAAAAQAAEPGAPRATARDAPGRPGEAQGEATEAAVKTASPSAAGEKEQAPLAAHNQAQKTVSTQTGSRPAPRLSAPGPATAASGSEVAAGKPAAPTESGSRTLTRALGLKIARIVIDPGHGGHDTGTVGPTGLKEKDLVLDVGLRLRKLIERRMGSEAVMTRDDDTFIPLEERTAIANEKAADLFISIHANASRDPSARGIETYYLNFTSNPDALEVAARENATSQESVHQLQDLIKKIALTEKIEESREFASQVQHQVHTRLAKGNSAERNRGVKKAPFVVLIGANMPSVLAEISFLTNPRDERMLKRADYRQKIAEAIYQGVARYVNTLSGVSVAQGATLPSSPIAKSALASHPAGRPNF